MDTSTRPPVQGQGKVLPMPSAESPKRAQPAIAAPAPEAPPAAPPKKKRNVRRLALMVLVPLLLVLGGAYYWLTGGRYEDTDNAYVKQPKVSLSADVAGRITEVGVKADQPVQAGAVMFRVDPQPFQIALDEAEAALAAARLNVEQLRAAYMTAQVKLAADQRTLDIRHREQARVESLAGKGVSPPSSLDDVQLATQQAQAAVDEDKQQVQSTLAALGGSADVKTDDIPAVKQAQATVAKAQLDLAKTKVTAPANGVVTQVDSLNVGQYITPGATIASLVEEGDTWVDANFKETQVGSLKVGQPASVVVDAYPGIAFHGTVDAVGPATGSEFSLIPAQNATGNWVKVVQRIPVRIRVPAQPETPLRTGMSATVSVDTGKSRLDMMTKG
ncbi:MAG: Membrane fusion component of tripartite multidrug resistance system [Hyphomicrobiales bacterium]|nr:Membrane fusion component of tripartite multidrug resistance system [Hyphomicrobiales bacterium]